MNQHMKDCHLEVYALCQDGMISINEMTIDFADGNNAAYIDNSKL